MVASEQLQKLGEEAVAEVSEEAESLREEVISLTQKYEEEVHRRREVEAELAQRTPQSTFLTLGHSLTVSVSPQTSPSLRRSSGSSTPFWGAS